MHFAPIKNTNILYYINQELVIGKEVNYTFHGENLINISEMVTPQLQYVNEGNKIKVVSITGTDINALKVVDRYSNEYDLEFNTLFDFYIKYIPLYDSINI